MPTAAGIGNYGMFGRNALRGPDYFNTNVTIKKVVAVRENLRVQYIADFFNMLNHAQFANPSTTITSSLFGQITSIPTNASPRIIQMALRLDF